MKACFMEPFPLWFTVGASRGLGWNQDKNGLHSPSGQAAIFKENQGSSLSSCEMWDYHMEFNSNLGILKEKKKKTKEIKQSLWALNNLLEWVFFSYAHFMDEGVEAW